MSDLIIMTTMIVNLIKILQLIGKYHAGHVITETVAIGNRQDGSLYSANTDSTVLLKPKNVSREKKFYLLAILQIEVSCITF